MPAPSLTRFFPDHLTLPTFSDVARKLMNTAGDENCSLQDLADIIAHDASLSAKVLRLANSARYSPSRSVSTIREAAAAVGTATLRNLAMAASMSESLPDVPGIDRQKFWRHSLACAQYAQILSREESVESEMAYLGGLLMRLGELLMLQIDPEATATAEALSQEPGSRFDWFKTRLGFAHSSVTAELARRWQFPEVVVRGFEAAGDPLDAKPFSRLGAVLHMAEIMADAMCSDQPPMEALQNAAPDLIVHEQLDLNWLEQHLFTQEDLDLEVAAIRH